MMTIGKYLIAAAAGAMATAAAAQISNIQPARSAELTVTNSPQVLPSPLPEIYYQSGALGGAGFSAKVDIQPEGVFFLAGSMAAGSLNKAKSTVELSFDFKNTGPAPVDKLVSTVFESNFGMFVTNFAPLSELAQTKAACIGSNLPACTPVNVGANLKQLTSQVDETVPFTLGYTSFLFEVVQDGAVRRSIGGTLQLDTDGMGNLTRTTGGLFAGLATDLSGFTEFLGSPDRVWAFSWGDTDVSTTLNAIANGQTSKLTYRVTTESWTDTSFAGGRLNTLLSFACFSDPVGRGTSGAVVPLTVPGFTAATCNDFKGLSPLLKIEQGGNTLYLTRDGAPKTPAIPEPDTWAMLILGFGLVGLSMRRGKAVADARAA